MTRKTIHPSHLLLISGFLSIFSGCGTTSENSEKKEETKTPVTLTTVSIEPMTETITLNAVSSFIRKNIVKASATGLVESIDINLGDQVEKGQVLFTLKTKEAAAYEKLNPTDTILSFKGEIKIKASKSGVISSISHQKGDYIQEGDELAQLAEQSSLAFLLEVPFELRQYVKLKETCQVLLSDNRVITGIIERKLATMDIQSQTESFVVRPNTTEKLPENLIVKVNILKKSIKQTPVLPKPAILSNETLTEFWVMKLINDSIAVKVPITKGIETDDQVEILAPAFTKSDRILLTGNYGLSDTAKITIKEK